MMGAQEATQMSRTKKVLLWLFTVGVVGTFAVLANFVTIVDSDWYKNLRLSSLSGWLVYGVIGVLSAGVIGLGAGLFLSTRRSSQIATRSSQIMEHERLLWKRFVRTFRSLALDHIVTPSTRDALGPLLNELARRLPDNGVHHKLAVARPNGSGTFSILAERGMDPTSVATIERLANWKEKRSFFSMALDLTDRPYETYRSGSTHYLDIQKPEGAGERPTTSGYHFIVPLKQDPHYEQLPAQTLALISIGIPKGQEFDSAAQEHLYQEIYPAVKSIEAVLLGFLLLGRIPAK
jgi:hypothetical protein